MDVLAIRQVRSFNRTLTEGIGALDDRFLGRARPITEARLLWEIGPDARTSTRCVNASVSSPGR